MTSSGNGLNPQQLKEQAQYLSMRGAQIAQQKSGQETNLSPAPKVSGTKKQLIGTIAAIVGVVAVLVLLSALHII